MNLNFSVNKLYGYEKATEFSFSISPIPLSAVTAIKWVFGDGNESLSFDPHHIYFTEGVYNPTAYVYLNDSTIVTATTAITVKPYVDESIYFDIIPPPTFAGHYQRYPFKVNITSKTIDDHYIDLSSMFSKSYKHQEVENKWSFLRPEWKFLDVNGNIIDRIKTTDTILKIDGDGNIDDSGITVGVSGTAQFYFIDDMYNTDLYLANNPYTTIIATLESTTVPVKSDYEKTKTNVYGYSNSNTIAFIPYVVLYRTAESLKITTNGIDSHKNPQWINSNTPLIVSPTIENDFPDYWKDGNGSSKIWKEDEFFIKYIPDTDVNIPLMLTLTGLSAYFEPTPVQFTYKDSDGFKTGGYYKGDFYTKKTDTLNCVLSAYTTFNLPSVSSNYYFPIMYVSNPEAKKVHNFIYFKSDNFKNVFYSDLLDNNNLIGSDRYFYHTFDIPVTNSDDCSTTIIATTGFHGVYSIAVTPFPDYHAWLLDSEKNYLYRYNTVGTMLCSIDIRKLVEDNHLGYLVPNTVTPAMVSLDSKKNLWITLYDSISGLKLDPYGNFLFAFTPSGININLPPNMDSKYWADSRYFPSVSTSDGYINLLEPTGIDVDIDDNVWVTYSSFISGHLVKYDNIGNRLFHFDYPLESCPQEIVCSGSGEVWVVCADLAWGQTGRIEKRKSDGTLLQTFSGLRVPSNATFDMDQNLWFTYDYNKVGKIDTHTNSTFFITITSTDISPYTPDYWFKNTNNVDESILEGISSDYRGNIYVISSIENRIYVINKDTLNVIDSIMINPKGMNRYVPLWEQPDITEEYNPNLKSLQAQGDWSGFRWINKYGKNQIPYYSTKTVSLSGISDPLNFYSELPYNVYKVNENFDLAQYMQNMAKMPVLTESTYLFDDFLSTIYGKDEYSDLGVKAYEKIANFLDNHSNIDTCNISQLYDLSHMVDLDSDDFILNYPEDIKRIVDMASVNESRLWGNLSNPTPDIVSIIQNQLPISTTTYSVTAGTTMLVYTKSLGTYELFQTGPIYNQNVYNIQLYLTSIGLDPQFWRSTYELYPVQYWNSQTYKNNLIDWSNEKTNITNTLSSGAYEWTKDQGILETMFSYYIFKGLTFIS